MPDGVVKWFDPKTGEAAITRSGRTFPARANDVETAARHAGAHVHFDIHRVRGIDQAIDVRLREGTRVSHHHRRFGTLAGARRIDTKGASPNAQAHPELRSADIHPLEVARVWATNVARGDAFSALALYSADAVMHVGGQVLAGRAALSKWLTETPLMGSARHGQIHGGDGTAVVSWEANGPEEPGLITRFRIAHAQITEQWVSEPAESMLLAPTGAAPPLAMALSTRGDVGDDAKRSAEDSVLRVVERHKEPVLFARVKLAWEPDPARLRPALAQVALDVDGDLVRAHVAARTMPEAIDLLGKRLRDQLEHRAKRRERLHRSAALPRPGEWRHGDLPARRPEYFDLPVEDRQLVRHKMFAVDELTPDEAVFDMGQLDYDFYLFRDLSSGSDSLIDRLEDGSYRLTRLSHSTMHVGPAAMPIEVSRMPVPVLALDAAIERLNAGGEPHIFFANATDGRGNVLYRRYDGHYGLITPD